MDDEDSRLPNERTSLLALPQRDHHLTSDSHPEDVSTDDEIEPNEFDNLLAKSQSHNTALGVEPASQETAMLRGERKYRRLSKASHQEPRRLSGDSRDENEYAVVDEEDLELKSPFLGGVSRGQFWLIFGGMLIMYFIACFDGTIMVCSPANHQSLARLLTEHRYLLIRSSHPTSTVPIAPPGYQHLFYSPRLHSKHYSAVYPTVSAARSLIYSPSLCSSWRLSGVELLIVC